MGKYIKISNQVEIEHNAFKLIGACTKRDDSSKIGFFGSGLKYALAVFLREGIAIRVFSGETEIIIGTETQSLRGEFFDVITIDGEKTSMTTAMGPQWEPWQAVREIYCNALDEVSGSTKVGDCEPCGVAGETRIFICAENERTKEIVDSWEKYFASSRNPLVEVDGCKIYENEFNSFYRRGIKCVEKDVRGIFEYDCPKVEINESRVLRNPFMLDLYVGRILGKYADKDILDIWIKNDDKEMIENHIHWGCSSIELGAAWLNYFRDKILIPKSMAGNYKDFIAEPNAIILPMTLIVKLEETFGKGNFKSVLSGYCVAGVYFDSSPDKKRDFLLSESLKFIKDVGLDIGYECKIVSFESNNVLGTIDTKNSLIILSEKLFNKGKRETVATILEEWAHLESKASDETREFQNYLIGQIITLLENQHGIFL